MEVRWVKGTGLRRMERGNQKGKDTCHAPESLNVSFPPCPTLLSPTPQVRRPPIPVYLTFVARAELEQGGQQEGQQQESHGVV